MASAEQHIAEAERLLVEAGYTNLRGEVLYETDVEWSKIAAAQTHALIAQAINGVQYADG